MKPPGEFSFDPETHTYRLDGRTIPSVTQVLEPLQELEGIPRETLEAARIFGQHVHTACNLMVRGELDWLTLDPILVPYVSAARQFLRDTNFVVLRSEYPMHDPALKVAGTVDLLGLLDKKNAVIDWKSSAVMSRTVGLQLAGYDHLVRKTVGGRPMKRYGVQLRGDGQYRLYHYDDPRDINWFFSALNLWWWRSSK